MSLETKVSEETWTHKVEAVHYMQDGQPAKAVSVTRTCEIVVSILGAPAMENHSATERKFLPGQLVLFFTRQDTASWQCARAMARGPLILKSGGTSNVTDIKRPFHSYDIRARITESKLPGWLWRTIARYTPANDIKGMAG